MIQGGPWANGVTEKAGEEQKQYDNNQSHRFGHIAFSPFPL